MDWEINSIHNRTLFLALGIKPQVSFIYCLPTKSWRWSCVLKTTTSCVPSGDGRAFSGKTEHHGCFHPFMHVCRHNSKKDLKHRCPGPNTDLWYTVRFESCGLVFLKALTRKCRDYPWRMSFARMTYSYEGVSNAKAADRVDRTNCWDYWRAIVYILGSLRTVFSVQFCVSFLCWVHLAWW